MAWFPSMQKAHPPKRTDDQRETNLSRQHQQNHRPISRCLYTPVHMFVLGIDPGLTTTGYGLVTDGPQAVAAGVIRTNPQAAVADRLLELHRDLTGLVAEHHPQVVAIEQVFSNRNLHTVANVGRAAGVAMLVAAQAGLAVHEYTPSSVKRAVAGYGNAPKEQVQKMVAQRLGLAELPRPADAADALAVALCHLQGAALAERVEAAR